jgi:hypothetical protein
MRVSEEPVCIYLFGQNPVFTSLHLKYPVHVVPPLSIPTFNPRPTGDPQSNIMTHETLETQEAFADVLAFFGLYYDKI